jgi:carboxypeptidase C (cathepsin A)
MTRIPLLALAALLLFGPLSGPAGAQAPAAAQAPPAAQALPQPAARAEAQPAASQPGVSQSGPSQSGASKSGASQPGADRTTTHSLALPSRTLDFAATVSTIRLANPAGAVQAEIVTTAFQLSGAAPGTRPVTFAVNGGPGASSAWLNLGAIGPWRVKLGGALPSTRPGTVDNMETWLDFTDLVFLDPPGTGFSRATGGDEARRGMQSVDGDIRTLASVIHRWLQAQGRLASPKFIAGESYGGFRGPKLARALLDQQGVGISGLVLVSPVLDFNGRDAPWDPMRWVGRLPSLAAAARGAAGRAELRDVEDYAAGDYLVDLVRGEHDAIATERLSRRVAELTGLDPALVRRRAGKPDLGAFLRDRDPGRVGSPYDATVTAADPFPSAANDNSPDPILDGLRGPLTGAMLDIYRNRLDWQPEGAPARQYFLLNDAIAREWDYGHDGNRPEALTELRQFLALDASARVLVAHGLTDLVTPYFASKLLLDQVPETVPPDRLQLRAYGGGHMFYSQDASRAALHEDAGALVGAALAAAGGAAPAR